MSTSNEEIEEERELSTAEDVELDVLEAYNELKLAKDEEPEDENRAPESNPAEEEPEEQEEEEQEPAEEEESEEQPEEKIPAPATWSAAGKEWFNSLPAEGKREIAKRAQDMERRFHQVTQEASRKLKAVEPIEETFNRYDEILTEANRGIKPDPKLKAQIVDSAIKLHFAVENDFLGTMAAIAQQKGMTLQQVAEAANGQPAQPQQYRQDPALLEMQQQIKMLTEERNSYKQAQAQERQTQVASQFEEVANQTDAQGRYLRPELHDETFVTSLRPTIQHLSAQFPGLSPREWMERAYTLHTGKAPQSSLGSQNGNAQHRSNAKRASLSVRTATPSSNIKYSTDVPDSIEETIRQTMRESGYDI